MSIPRRIIQTGKNRTLSPLAKASATNLRLLHPGWEYIYFDDADVLAFVDAEFPGYRATFDGFPHPIQRFDFFRYLAVYRLGGFYFDTDVLLYEPLDDLLPRESVFPFEEITLNLHLRRRGIDWELGNYAFGAEAGNSFLDAMVRNCVRALREPKWAAELVADIPPMFRPEFEVLCTTGPAMLTRTLVECQGLGGGITVLFPGDVCDSDSWHQFGGYGTHLMEGSWRLKGSPIRRRMFWLWAARLQRRLLRESRALGTLRAVPGTLLTAAGTSALKEVRE